MIDKKRLRELAEDQFKQHVVGSERLEMASGIIDLLNSLAAVTEARDRLADIVERDLSSFACDTREVQELRKAGQ